MMTHKIFRFEAKILQPEQINIFLSQLRMTNPDSGLVIDQSELREFLRREKIFWLGIPTWDKIKFLGWVKRWTRSILARIGTSSS